MGALTERLPSSSLSSLTCNDRLPWTRRIMTVMKLTQQLTLGQQYNYNETLRKKRPE